MLKVLLFAIFYIIYNIINKPELFIKNVDTMFNKININVYIILSENQIDCSVFNVLSIHNRHFVPFGRADLTTKSSL
jgi:hypothetical protein